MATPYDDLMNQTAYQAVPQMPTIRGEVPYGVPRENIFQRIRSKLGDARIAGLIGALTMPEGRIDESYQRVGPSPFQAGLLGYQQGVRGYEDRQLAQAKAVQDQDIAAREVRAKELTAKAARDRAWAYDRYVTNRIQNPRAASMTPAQRNQDRLNWYLGLTPEQQKVAQQAGIVPRDPREAAKSNEDEMVSALVSEFRFTEPEARIIAQTRPQILSTGQEYDLGKWKQDKKITLQNIRRYGVPMNVRRIIEGRGYKVEDVYGLIGTGEATTPGPGGAIPSREQIMQMSQEEIDAALDSIPPGAPDELFDWAQERIDELEEQGLYREAE